MIPGRKGEKNKAKRQQDAELLQGLSNMRECVLQLHTAHFCLRPSTLTCTNISSKYPYFVFSPLFLQCVEWCTFIQGCQCKFSLRSLKASFKEAGPSSMLCDTENHLETNPSPIFSSHTSVIWNTLWITSEKSRTPLIRITFACSEITD